MRARHSGLLHAGLTVAARCRTGHTAGRHAGLLAILTRVRIVAAGSGAEALLRLLRGLTVLRLLRLLTVLARVRIVAGLATEAGLLRLLRLTVLRLLRLAVLRLLRLTVLARVGIVPRLTAETRLLRLTGLAIRAAGHELRLPEVGLLSRTRGKSVAAGGLIHGDDPTLGWLCCAKNLPCQADERCSDEGDD